MLIVITECSHRELLTIPTSCYTSTCFGAAEPIMLAVARLRVIMQIKPAAQSTIDQERRFQVHDGKQQCSVVYHYCCEVAGNSASKACGHVHVRKKQPGNALTSKV